MADEGMAAEPAPRKYVKAERLAEQVHLKLIARWSMIATPILGTIAVSAMGLYLSGIKDDVLGSISDIRQAVKQQADTLSDYRYREGITATRQDEFDRRVTVVENGQERLYLLLTGKQR